MDQVCRKNQYPREEVAEGRAIMEMEACMM